MTDSFPASGTWTAPAGVTSVTVEAWGGGGAGGGATNKAAEGGGGAGGQYATKVIAVVSGTNYAVVVGTGGTGSTGSGTAGGNSTFAATTVVAQGGAGGTGDTNGSGGAAGTGTTTGGIGGVVYAGGSGSNGVISNNGKSCLSGGAGGGGAGSTGAGGSASGNTAGTGTANYGGAGGTGINNSSNGNAGNGTGGGGGAACAESTTNQSGGNGAAGLVNIIYYPVPTVTAISPTSGPTAGGTSVTITGTNFTGATAVTIGGVAATGISVVNATTITATTPAGTAGAKNVVVTTPGGTATGTNLYTYIAAPTVTSISPTSGPTAGGTSVTITGTNFTGATAVTIGGTAATSVVVVSATSITAVTPAGTAGAQNVVVTTPGGTGTGTNLYTYVAPPFCSPPSNTPAGVTLSCVCDQFGRANLNPSTIFGGNWTLSHGTTDSAGTNPYINTTTGLLRLTENTNNNAKAATVPSIFPAAGNYISVEFMHYAYGGGNPGADGIAVTLSDYTVPAVPGGFGGSLGYAQRSDSTPNPPGFAGGWVGIALDEYGNFQNPTEGRIGGPGARAQSVGVRGPGSGTSGYRYMGGTASSPGGYNISANSTSSIPATGYMYQVIVDARNSATGAINVAVNRDATTKDGSTYASIFGPFNAYTEANYALSQGWTTQLVPDYWKISFTGSTGGSTDVHEIGSLRICAQTVLPASGGTASGFSAIDEAYTGSPVPAYSNFQTGDIYTKLAGTPFKLWVAALASTAISTGYSATTNKYVQVKVVDNTDNACGPDSARTCNSACSGKAAVETGATQIALFPSGSSTGVASPSPSFTLNSSYRNLVAVMKECTTSACTAFTSTAPACSADSFSVRPLNIASVASSNAINTTTTGTPIFKAGGGNFSLTATTTGVVGNPSGYNGVLKINNATLQPTSPAAVAGTIAGSFPAATPGTPSSIATGSTFTYSEVGGFTLPGYNPTTDTTSRRGVFDGVATADECTAPGLTTIQCDALKSATWTGVDSISTKGDCVPDSYSNTKNAAGKYGCNFGMQASTATIGRFVPDHFAVTSTFITNRADFAVTGSIAAGSGLLVLSSAAGVRVGDTISVAGAGVAGAAFSSTVQAVSANGKTVTLATNAVTAVTNVPVNVSAFTYMGEPMNAIFTLTAQSANNTTTQNYTGTLAKLNPLAAVTTGASGPLGFGMVNNAVTRTPFTVCTASPANPCFTPSTASGSGFVNGVATGITVPLTVYRGTSPVGPYAALNIGIAPVDSDGVTTIYNLDTANVVSTTFDHTSIASTGMIYGSIIVSNAHGSELLQLPVKVYLQYWNGLNFVANSADNLTKLNITSVNSGNWTNLTPGNWQKLSVSSTWVAGATGVVPSTASVVFVNGAGNYTLAASGQGNTGSVDVLIPSVTGTNCLVASMPLGCYLPSNTARATFGVYKGPSEFIYLRENY